jgi:hypothetical protein
MSENTGSADDLDTIRERKRTRLRTGVDPASTARFLDGRDRRRDGRRGRGRRADADGTDRRRRRQIVPNPPQ